MVDFDAWRARYPSTSWVDQVAFYDTVWSRHPDQRHYDASSVRHFLDTVTPESVIELGGWRGELAAEMLEHFPGVQGWTNYEVCRGAVDHAVTDDPRYASLVPTDWPWREHLVADALVLSHTVEHMSFCQFVELLDNIDIRAIYIAAPLHDEPTSWHGYWGSHVLEVGWNAIDHEIVARGFVEILDLRVPNDETWGEVRCWKKSER